MPQMWTIYYIDKPKTQVIAQWISYQHRKGF